MADNQSDVPSSSSRSIGSTFPQPCRSHLRMIAAPPKTQAADVMASIVAERIIAHLDRAGFVVVQKPAVGAAALGGGFEG